MTRAGAAWLLLALAACGKERPDPRLAEVTSPLHVTVRVIDAAAERTCAGTTMEQLGCFLSRAEREGCVYAELGAAAEAPVRTKQPDAHRCGLLALTGPSEDRALLRQQPGRKATLSVEPRGERVVVDVGDAVHALYVRGGHLAIQRKLWDAEPTRPPGLILPDGTLNWSLVPPFLSVLDEVQLAALTGPELDALLAQTPGGKAALKDSLLALTGSADLAGDAWGRALSKLEPADRAEVREAMLSSLSGGAESALDWFLHHPEEQGQDFVDALEEAVDADSFEMTMALPALLRLAPLRAEKVACAQLERSWHENTGNGTDSYGFMPPDTATLAVIVSRRAKCPWVLPLLERIPCAWELRCDPDLDDQKQTPLCTPAQSAKALERALHPDAERGEADELEAEADRGALLVAAALVQGPLPPALLLSDARRQYALAFTFQGDEEEDLCRDRTEEPADWACRLPPTVSTSTQEGCRLVVDDAKRTLTLTPAPER